MLRPSIPSAKRESALLSLKLHSIGLPGIEPGLHDPQPCVLPVYYSPLHTDCSRISYQETVVTHSFLLETCATPTRSQAAPSCPRNVVTDIFLVVARKFPRPRLAVSSSDSTSLRLAQFYVVTDIFLAVARKFPRPRLAVPHACGTTLRPAHVKKSSTQVLFFYRVHPSGFEPETFRM